MTHSDQDRYWTNGTLPGQEAGPTGTPQVSSHSSVALSAEQTSGPPEDSLWSIRHEDMARLAAAAKDGDPAAIRTLLSKLLPYLLRVVRRILGPTYPDLEDVVYDAAHAVLDGLPRYRGEGTFLHYACRVAAFTATNARRQNLTLKRNHEQESIDLEICAAEEPDPEQQILNASLVPIVRELVATLPRPTAEALTLQVILGHSVQEIAEMCNVPVETVRSRLRLARQALRRRILGDPELLEALEVES